MAKAMGNVDGKLAPFVGDRAVVTSAELITALRRSGCSIDNARQQIKRHSNTKHIWRSEGLKLARGERLFARRNFVGQPGFLLAVGEKLIRTSRRGLGRLLAVLNSVHVLNKVEALRLLAVSPTDAGLASQPSRRLYESELCALSELGVRVIHAGTQLESIVSPSLVIGDDADSIAAIAAERVRNEALLSRVILNHLRRQNIVAWNRLEIPVLDVPFTVFNGQVFSGFGFSYLSPVVRWKQDQSRPTPCPVLLDCYHERVSLAQVQSFAQRIERATNRGKSQMKVLGAIAARDFEKDAWSEARRRGFTTINLRQVFGAEALDAMVVVERLLHGSFPPGADDGSEGFQKFAELLSELKTNPIVVTLRSIGFEALSGLILRSHGFERVEMGRIVPWKETSRDVDVFGIRGDELFVVECKAYHRRKSIPGGEVSKFFTETLPALKKWLREHDVKFSRCTAELWTTGPLGNTARDELFQLKRPAANVWQLIPLNELEERLPDGIRKRSIELLRSIALTAAADVEDIAE